MFWKKTKNKHESITAKQAGMAVKGAANTLLQDFTNGINPVEVVILNQLVGFMDTFILKCFEGDKLKNSIWILARLMEVKIVLQASRTQEVRQLASMISSLEELIYIEKEKK